MPISGVCALVCPACTVQNQFCGSAAVLGNCKNWLCRRRIGCAGNAYCGACSLQLISCSQCGEKIQEGSVYIPKITKVYQKLIDSLTMWNPEENVESIQEDIDALDQKYGSLTQQQVLELSKKTYREDETD